MKNKIKNKKAFSLIELSIVVLIVGIVVAGVTQSSRLIGAFRVSTAKNLTQSSPVAGIRGLVFWYETSLDSSFIDSEEENNTVVSTWYDNNPQSTIKYHAYAGQKTNSSSIAYNLASSSTSGNTSGPTYIVNGINNVPTLRFTNATTTYRYMVSDFNAKNTNTQDITMFFVFYYRSGSGWIADRSCNNSTTGYAAACSSATNGGNPLFGAQIQSNNLYFDSRSDTGANAGSSFYFDTGYDVVANRKYVLTLERKYGSAFKAYVNGVVTSTTQSDGIAALSMDPVKIGRHADNNTDTLDSDISEVIFFSGPIKAADRVAVEQYLGKKYGINI